MYEGDGEMDNWHKFLNGVSIFILILLLVFAYFVFAYHTTNENYYNAIVKYGDGQEVKIYEEYPYRRLNDLNTHYTMRNGQQVHIEKVVDVTTGNVYFLVNSGSGVSLSPVYDSDGKLMKLTPGDHKVESVE